MKTNTCIAFALAAGLFLSAFGAPTGLALDFTKGTPAGGALRGKATLGADGLRAPDTTDLNHGVGFALKKRFDYPEAFRVEADLVLEPNGRQKCDSVLWDDMIITYNHPQRPNAGLQIGFDRHGDKSRPIVTVGLGGKTYSVNGPTLTITNTLAVSLAVTYDANGGISFRVNGIESDAFIPLNGPLTPARYTPVVGDRYGSLYHPFEGLVRRFSIRPIERPSLVLKPGGRRAFQRAEANATLDLTVASPVCALTDVRATVRQSDGAGTEVACRTDGPRDLAKDAKATFSFPVETRLKPGPFKFALRLEGKDADGKLHTVERTVDASIGPTFPERMTTLMWMSSAPYSVVADYGFTHGIGRGLPGPLHPGQSTAWLYSMYDSALAGGLKLAKYAVVQYPEGRDKTAYYRLGRDGKSAGDWHKKPIPEVSNPEMIAYARTGSEADVQVLGEHPAFGGVLAVSENRDHTFPSYNTEQKRYLAETGVEPPPEAVKKVANWSYAKKKYPDGIVPEDDPVLRYYRWFWHGGDGWPAYLGSIANGYRPAYGRFEDGSDVQKRRPFFSFHDPAVRCPPVWGSGGDVDVLSQWCYANPEPMNVAGPIEEMFAMAEGRPGQQVMSMTQLICYRRQLAPKDVKVDPMPEWVKRRPGADFPSIPPDTLQEATWSMIAKPVRGIMYHGWGCIYETGKTNGYTYTNTETTDRIKYLLKDVVAPLGPSLLKIGRARNAVAVLESGTTALLGGPASWGWTAPSVTFLQRARLDPRVIYEEAIEKDGVDASIKVLYAPQLQYTTPKVARAIRDFQARGGIFVGDGQTLKALKPDIVAPVVSFSAPPASDHQDDVEAMENAKGTNVKARSATANAKRIMQRQAEQIRVALAGKGYRPASDSSSPEIVVYNRRWKSTPYLFAINDRRTFGDYVGQWGLTMEKGLPFEGRVTLAGAAAATEAVYELSRGAEVAFSKEGGDVVVPVRYETNDGRLFAFLPEKIGEIEVEAPRCVSVGDAVDVTVTVRGRSGRPVPAVLPVEIRLYDAAGAELDGGGYAAAEDGVAHLRIPTNLNDAPGEYRLVCRDRASGCEASAAIVRGDRPWWMWFWFADQTVTSAR